MGTLGCKLVMFFINLLVGGGTILIAFEDTSLKIK